MNGKGMPKRKILRIK